MDRMFWRSVLCVHMWRVDCRVWGSTQAAAKIGAHTSPVFDPCTASSVQRRFDQPPPVLSVAQPDVSSIDLFPQPSTIVASPLFLILESASCNRFFLSLGSTQALKSLKIDVFIVRFAHPRRGRQDSVCSTRGPHKKEETSPAPAHPQSPRHFPISLFSSKPKP